ncbi:MAG: hypothetical protein ACT4O1_11485 [Gemmatimonadota bacterium]
MESRNRPHVHMTAAILGALLVGVGGVANASAVCPDGARQVESTLFFPQPGLDDPAAYDGYQTRFVRDYYKNTFQIYIKQQEGRIVNLWGNSANESAGFTLRDTTSTPAQLSWVSDSACVAASGRELSVEYRLRLPPRTVRVGHFALGSMRIERDVQYAGLHLKAFAPSFVPPEFTALVETVGRLPEPQRSRHLALVNAASHADLTKRLLPTLRVETTNGQFVARVEQSSLDGRTRLLLELAAPAADARFDAQGPVLQIQPQSARSVVLTVRVTTNAEPLTPLSREEIFDRNFLAFHDSLRTVDPQRFRRLERQVRGMELVSSREKLMAGLPNYATYFGRDMLVTALLMQPIWASTTSEHVVASVLRKLSPTGEVSHEEALGGQAIREHAQQYNALVAGSDMQGAELVLRKLSQVRENYHMVDDEFQFPVLVAKYLADARVPDARKRAFLGEVAGDSASRLTLLLRNLILVTDLTARYAADPAAQNLISFPPKPGGGYYAASWRDSNAGYGGGRFAMDVNAIWVPQALAGIGEILRSLERIGISAVDLERAEPRMRGSVLATYARDAAALGRAVDTWRGSIRHFTVSLSAQEAHSRIAARLASLPPHEAQYWRDVQTRAAMPDDGLEFLAVSLDQAGKPIGIASTDIATRWFLEDITAAVLADPARTPAILKEIQMVTLPYPHGLLIERLGPVVANDAFATPDVWAGFQRDDYHSPRVVWGREVNLLLLGFMRQIGAAYDATGQLRSPALRPYVVALEDAMRRTLAAVEESGLKHNELWSYRIEGDRLIPIRWGSSSDVQLWNLTNLVVQYLISRVPN